MSLEETKQLLRTFRISPNKLLGQNFMVEPAIYAKLCEYAVLGSDDVVLDAGAGFGFLSRFIAERCREVIAVEKDPQVAEVLKQQTKDCSNVKVIVGDVLQASLPPFNKAVSVPPYYLSSNLVEWLMQRELKSAVLIVQKEFAEKLVAPVGSEEYGWLGVMVSRCMETQLLDAIPKDAFYPEPKVDSIIISLKPFEKPLFNVNRPLLFRQLTKWLFSQRNKKVSKATTSFLKANRQLSKEEAEKVAVGLPFKDKRPRELTPQQFGELANAVAD